MCVSTDFISFESFYALVCQRNTIPGNQGFARYGY